MTNATATKTSPAFMLQAGVAFCVALVGVIIGECQLPVDPWVRGFLALGTVFLVSSTFTLAKVIRDQFESGSVVSRLDQARLERLLAEFDPYHVPPLSPDSKPTSPASSAPMAPPVPGGPPAPYAAAYPNGQTW
jgi:hypothetical protein